MEGKKDQQANLAHGAKSALQAFSSSSIKPTRFSWLKYLNEVINSLQETSPRIMYRRLPVANPFHPIAVITCTSQHTRSF